MEEPLPTGQETRTSFETSAQFNVCPVLHSTGKELACVPVGLPPDLKLGAGVRVEAVAEYHHWGLHDRSAVLPGRRPAVIIHIPVRR